MSPPSFWDRRMETLPLGRRQLLRDHRLHWQLRRCWEGSAWHRARLGRAGIDPATFRGLSDLHRIPLLADADLETADRAGDTSSLAVAPSHWWTRTVSNDLLPNRILTDSDEIHRADLAARALWAAGARQERMLGWLHAEERGQAAEDIAAGATRIGMVRAHESGTLKRPEVGMVVAAVLRPGESVGGDTGLEPDDALAVWCAAWPLTLDTGPPGATALRLPFFGSTVAHTCEANRGLHWADDHYLVEILDTATNSPMPEGETGALVITELTREGTPLLRYWTGLEAAIETAPCPCGRTSARSRLVQPLVGPGRSR